MRHDDTSREASGRTLAAIAAAIVAPALALSGCEGLLDVDLPGRVIEDELNDPSLAQTLTRSVIGDVECSWDNYAAAAAHHSDEWFQASGNTDMKRWGLRKITSDFASYASGDCVELYGLFTPLHTARVQADKNFERIQGFPDDSVRNKTALLARIRAWGTWPLVAFAETFCGTPLDGSEKVYGSAELFSRAEEGFTEAIELARQAGLTRIQYMAMVGRARARIGLEDFSGAIADAEKIPEGFRFEVTRDAQAPRRMNSHYEMNGRAEEDEGEKLASIAESYRDVRWKDVEDPRVNVFWDGTLAHDFVTKHYRHDKVNSFSDNLRLASWAEAQMFIAEAAARSGNLERARNVLQMFHERAGIPPVTESDIPTQEDVIRHVIEERRREFFSEGGHRLHDMIRFRGTQFEIPFLGEPGSDHPNGVDQNGVNYGDATCFPVPLIEETGTT